ncbi:hypothetical protein J6TS2_42720 [Heyndrickxia sporothermodurans]|nr:hypothetical protein J6TS2_42720 [Heyndrickxia sporothermodurans]
MSCFAEICETGRIEINKMNNKHNTKILCTGTFIFIVNFSLIFRTKNTTRTDNKHEVEMLFSIVEKFHHVLLKSDRIDYI